MNYELGMQDSRRRGVKEFAMRIVKETSSVKERVRAVKDRQSRR